MLATRGLARRVVGGLLTVFGAGAAVTVSLHLPAAAVLAAAAAAGGSSTSAGSVTGGSAAGPAGGAGGAAPGVAAANLAGHVTMTGVPWRWAVLVGALAVVAAGLLVAWRGPAWPVMSSRYDQPAVQRSRPADPATLWDSLSQGVDPTDASPGTSPGTSRR